MSLLANPLFLRMAVLFVVAVAAIVLGALLIRNLRHGLSEPIPAPVRTDTSAFPVATYSAVIQKLKEKEDELERLRHQASTRAAASENISTAVLSNLASGVLLFNASGLVQQANRAAREILGYASISGLGPRDVFRTAGSLRHHQAGHVPPATHNGNGNLARPLSAHEPGTLAEAVELSLHEGLTFRRLEADYITPASQHRVLGITISPVVAASGQKLGAACLISNLTEIVRLGRQVQVRENLAALGEMSAGIAHEFKNSLATISGYSQMLSEDDDPASMRDFAARIRAETAVLSRIVTDFLNFARPQVLHNETISLGELLTRSAEQNQVKLHLEAEVAQELRGDSTALAQAFANLFRNSREAAGERVPQVDVSIKVAGEHACIRYRDDAGGIPEEVLPRIFIPFFTTKSGGTGLGLALVHRIITQHGGAISVSNEGGGAAFTLLLPLAKERSTVSQAS